MTTILEKTSFENSLISDLNLEQVVSLLLNVNSESSIFLELKNQLLSKGLDNIYERINVKKVIKQAIIELENKINELEGKNSKKELSLNKLKFLTLISVNDKLQIQWLKHDLKAHK